MLSNFSTEEITGFEPVPEQQQLQDQVVIGGYALPGQQQYPVTFEGAGSETGLPEQPAHPVGGAVGGACDGQLAEQFLHTMNQTNNGDHFSELTDSAVQMKRGVHTITHKSPPIIVLEMNIYQNDIHKLHGLVWWPFF